MTQEALFQDLKVFIQKEVSKDLKVLQSEIADLKKTVATQESVDEIMIFLNDTVATKEDLAKMDKFMRSEFVDVRYQMADMQTSINNLDIKIDNTASALRKDFTSLKVMVSQDIAAFGKDVVGVKKLANKLEENCY